jgi:O-antigen/teichoic acid export membrane protein
VESGALIQDLPGQGGLTRPEAGGRLGRNVTALAGGQLVTWTMTLAWTLVVPRLLGPAAIGLIVTAWSVTGILAIALGFGTRNYLVRAIVVDPKQAPPLVATATVLRIMLSPVFLVAVVVYAHFAHYGHEGTLVLYLAGGATILTLLAEPMQAAFQAIERMEYLAISDVINKSVQGLLGIVLAIAGLGAVGFAGCWLVMSGVVLVLDALWLAPYVRLGLRTTVSRLISMARESVAYWAFGLFFMIYLWIDTAMLSLITNPTVVGWYGVPTKIFQTLMFVPVLFSTAWLPRLVSVFERAPEELGRAARTPIELTLLLGLPIGALMATAAEPLIHIVYGSRYAHAVPVMVILGLCVAPMYFNIMLSQVLIAAKRQVVWTWLMAGATVINPAVNAVLIPLTQDRYGNGAIGAAISLLVTELLIVAAGLVLGGRGLMDRGGLRRLVLTAFASAAMWATGFALRPLGAVPSLAAAGAVFVLLAVVLRLVTADEVAFVRARVPGLARRFRAGGPISSSEPRPPEPVGQRRPWSLNGGQAQDTPDHVTDGVSKRVQTLRRHALVSERYLEGKVAIHVHLRLAFRDRLELPPDHVCAVFQRRVVEVGGFAGEFDPRATDSQVGAVAVRRHEGEDRAVHVLVGELAEEPDRMAIDLVRSVVRLRALDMCEHGAGAVKSMEPASALLLKRSDVSREFVRRRVDRIGGAARRRRDDPAREMIQRGAQTVDVIAADDRNARRWLLLEHYADAVATGCVVHIDDISVGFAIDESADFVCQGHQVLVCAIQLGPDAV